MGDGGGVPWVSSTLPPSAWTRKGCVKITKTSQPDTIFELEMRKNAFATGA